MIEKEFIKHPEAVFCDVDGTLVDNKGDVLESTKQIIKELYNKGIPFVPVSGRGASGMLPLIEEIGVKCPLVACNGAMVYDENTDLVFSKGYGKQVAKEIIAFVEEEKLDVAWHIYSGLDWIVKDVTDSRIDYEENVLKAKAKNGTPDMLPDDVLVNKIMLSCNPKELEDITDFMANRFRELSVTHSSGVYCEIMEFGIDKERGIAEYCKVTGINPKHTISIGDGHNDIPMFDATGFVVAMGNATPEIKAIADYITDDNKSDGIFNALKNLCS